ncbi:unnamed protein product [Sphagnum jensenii]|uniref:Uncharacterized protein n=2 Tax=Sphagnum jensenii TaxID=128206 RepID=A0ABP0VJX4_9BRYO
MSSSSNEDIPIKLAQEIREHRIIRRFDFSTVPEGPHRGAVILRALGFGVVRLTMVAEVRDLDADKLFKIAKLNLRDRAREWLRRLHPAPADWIELRTLILQKYGNVDVDDIRAKLDAI